MDKIQRVIRLLGTSALLGLFALQLHLYEVIGQQHRALIQDGIPYTWMDDVIHGPIGPIFLILLGVAAVMAIADTLINRLSQRDIKGET